MKHRLTLPALVAPLITLVCSTGCLIDFDQFGTTAHDAGPDPTGRDQGSDLGRDGDLTPETEDAGFDGDLAGGAELGALCDADSECAGGRCWEGYCSRGCTATTECPGAAFCAEVGGEGLCVLSCAQRQGCSDAANRSDLVCARLLPAEAGGGRLGACLPDADADAVADVEDNCLADANARQSDLDLDGMGDVCDPEPRCIDGHVDGVVAYGPATYGAANPAVPGYARDWFVVAGGDAADGLANTALLVDRATAAVTPITLPYPARAFAAAPLGPDEFLLSPGAYGGEGQFGRFVHVSRSGATRLGDPFQIGGAGGLVHDPTFAVGPDRTLWMHAYLGPASAGATAWRLYRYDAQRGVFVETPGGNDGVRATWDSTTDAVGRIVFYSTVLDPAAGLGRVVVIEPGAAAGASTLIQYPKGTDTAFVPFFVPAPGGSLYVYDRLTGAAHEFEGQQVVEPAIAELSVTPDLVEARWVSHPTGPGFTIVGHRMDDPTMLEVRSYSPGCFPGAAAVDGDADGVPDPVDLCPASDVVPDADADFDGIGDACDLDADGDALADADSAVPGIDTDDDGMTNDVDSDDDDDHVPDAGDRYPLDTDNDAVSNAFDVDDDDDGFFDADERLGGSDPTAPLSFPGSGALVWTAAGKLWFAPFEDPSTKIELSGIGSIAPAHPRFDAGGEHVLVLGAAPGVATTLQLLAASGGGVSYDVGTPLLGADPVSVDGGALLRAVVTRVAPQNTMRSEVAVFDALTGTSSMTLDLLTPLGPPDFAAGSVAFLGEPPGCATCVSAYTVALEGGPPRLVASNVSNPVSVRYSGASYALIADASDRPGRAVWVAANGDATEMSPPLVTDVFSVVGSADGHLIVSAKDEKGNALWFYNGAKDRWHRLLDLAEPAMDIDWTR